MSHCELAAWGFYGPRWVGVGAGKAAWPATREGSCLLVPWFGCGQTATNQGVTQVVIMAIGTQDPC